MRTTAITNDLPMPIWIALMILGFILFWPLGVMIAAYLIWTNRMKCCTGKLAPWKSNDLKCWNTGHSGDDTTGNVAFDEYRENTLKRLEDERQDFAQFLERLRRAKDQEEFDRFMSEQTDRRPPQ